MSFLNPVNEPVLRFSSTDADAPQIDYNSRTAGDVKAVLKACLVDGYGTTASAGWSVVNEVDHVAEFVSPSAAMSDYRLGIDDTSTSSTTYYYQYQGLRTNPPYNTPGKSIRNIENSSPSNGWRFLVTERGFYFVELFTNSALNATVSRLTWFGQSKLAVENTDASNIGFWTVGHDSPTNYPYAFFDPSNSSLKHYQLSGYTGVKFSSANITMFARKNSDWGFSSVEIAAPLYITYQERLIAEHAGILLKDSNTSDNFGVYDTDIGGRPALHVCLGWSNSGVSGPTTNSRVVLIYLDYWGY